MTGSLNCTDKVLRYKSGLEAQNIQFTVRLGETELVFTAQSRWRSERVKSLCVSTLLKSECVNWKAPFSTLVQLFMKGWLIHFLWLVKLSKTEVKFSIGRAGLSVTMGTVVEWLSGNGKYSPIRNINVFRLVLTVQLPNAQETSAVWGRV